MSLRSVAELQAYYLAQIPSGGVGNVFAVNERNVVQALMESLEPQNTAISYAGVPTTFEVTGTYQKLTTFNNEGIDTPAGIFVSNVANNRIVTTTKCTITPSLSFNGEWGTNVELFLEVRADDVPIISLPAWVQNGNGIGKPFDMFKSGIILSSAVTDGGNISLWIKGSSAITLTINKLQFNLGYAAFSIVNP